MLGFALVLLGVVLVICFVAWYVAMHSFTGADLSQFDSPRGVSMGAGQEESPEHAAAAREIAEGLAKPPPAKGNELIQLMRKHLDSRGEAFAIEGQITSVDTNEVKGEWIVAPHANPARRLLYIHGGGYVMGSPKSHRRITNRLSKVSRAAVFAIDYRLMPENSRMAGVEDCRAAYDWILANGPDGPQGAETLIVAGDSSGGNLALSTIAWARDTERQTAAAVLAICPQTDATLASPSLVRNAETDVMQGKSFGPIVRAPRVISLWFAYVMYKLNPSNPILSPLLGDLSNLPPTLLHASEAEMFLDDAIRYANKATSQGSTAVAHTWPFAMHVWHNFDVPEADMAFRSIEEFLERYAP